MSVRKLDIGTRLRPGLSFSGVVRFLSLAVLAGGLAVGYGVSSAKAATFNTGLWSGVVVDQIVPGDATLDKSWYSDDYLCAGGACNDTSIQATIETLIEIETIDYFRYDGLSGGSTTYYIYDGLARTAFAIKGGGQTLAVLLFDKAVTGWRIIGLPYDVSNVSSVNPIPLPPAALLFLTGLAGMGLLARRRRARLGGAAA